MASDRDYLIKVEVNREGTEFLSCFLSENKPDFGFRVRSDFHCTVLYTKEKCTPLPYRFARIKGNAKIVGVDVFGNCLVLLLESDFLRRRNYETIMFTEAKPQFAEYTPHLTLGYLEEPQKKDELEKYKKLISEKLVGKSIEFYEERAKYM